MIAAWIIFVAGVVMAGVTQRRAFAINRRERERLSGPVSAVVPHLAVDAAAPGPDRTRRKPAVDDDLGKRIRRALGAGNPRTKRGRQLGSLRRKDTR